MSDVWTKRLSAYIDGELSPEESADLQRHLAECRDCSTTLGELRSVVEWAAAYPGRAPERDTWPAIDRAIGASPPGVVSLRSRRGGGRRIAPLPRAIAAGFALAVVAAGSWWLARATAPDARLVEVLDISDVASGTTAAAAISAAHRYGSAIAELERVFLEQEDSLDPRTVKVVQDQLATIDRALVEVQRALVRDPGSSYLADHYTGMMKKKLGILRAATRAPATRS